MNISENTFISWASGPSDTETAKCENAETAVRKAIAADSALQNLDISVFAQGSYRARTNVRLNSDVDICVRYNSAFFPDFPPGLSNASLGLHDGALIFSDFKDMLQRALENRFGKDGVSRGNKAFDIHANSYRIDADVVPTFLHRRYTGSFNADGTHHFYSGVAFYPDKGSMVKNWPQQVYDNGVRKNKDTGRVYKRVIRIMKRLRDKMQGDGVAEASKISSFLIECIVWNANFTVFSKNTFTEIIRCLIIDIWTRTQKDNDCKQWGEVNELKYLFNPSQPWTREQVNFFCTAAWNFIGFK